MNHGFIPSEINILANKKQELIMNVLVLCTQTQIRMGL